MGHRVLRAAVPRLWRVVVVPRGGKNRELVGGGVRAVEPKVQWAESE